jgi:hypothetical protein
MSKLAEQYIDEVVTCEVCSQDLPLAELPVSMGEGKWRHPECQPMPEPKPILVKAEPSRVRASEAELVMRRVWGDAVALVRGEFPDASGDATVQAASSIAVALFNRTAGL